MRSTVNWRLRTRSLELGGRTLVCGVVNITPDSFSDGGFFLDSEKAVAHASRLMEEGADLLDLGAESTRPGSRAGGADAVVHPNDKNPPLGTPVVSADEEQARLLLPNAVISVDTYKAATARAALAAGAEIVNDVSGFTWDAAIAEVCAEFGAGVILSHTRGRPEEWRAQPQLAPDALVATVREGLSASLAAAQQAGIATDQIVVDPGYGFGKRFSENYVLLNRQAEFLALGRPLLAGLSRKSFLGHTLAPLFGGPDSPIDAPLDQRENASLAAMTAAILHGASIVRVHRVRPAVEAARIADAILRAGATEQGAER